MLDAAVEALTEGGTARFSFADVAKRAGVNETSLYRRWRTRENLLVDAALAASDQHIPVPDTGSVREDLQTFATLVAHYLNDPLGSALARVTLMAVDDPELAEARERFWRSRIELATVMIERGIARGELRPGTDPRLALEALIAPLAQPSTPDAGTSQRRTPPRARRLGRRRPDDSHERIEAS